ncbi:LEC14B-like [Citrus sinensis]|uniref:LEC14B-like n=1 Tax=Citrus sinensis TaxID=2711 RepID=A0ACB8I9P3_CITSI|nr:LEC14B-like [Citrus sinensis]
MGRFGKGVSSRDDGYASSSGSLSQGGNGQSDYLDHEIAQLTKLRSQPHEFLSRTAPGKLRLPVSTVKMLVGREVNYSGRGRFSAADSCHVLSRYLPVNGPWKVDGMNSRVYTSHFSNDGSFFVAASQESNIKIYNVDKNWKIQKDIETKALRWTITDTSLSPDQRFLVYASICAIVNIVDVGSSTRESLANVTEIHEGLDFSADGDEDEFGIFSVKFSTDGQELVAAGSDNFIYVYDLQANKCSLRIPAHKSDVNTVCFADETGHLIFSGSDDSLCKVWDRRCFISKGRANGVLMGHLEGITFIDSRRDGRYFISNGKDQTTKLWDIRKMSSNTTDNSRLRDYDWDYRWMEYPSYARRLKHPHDQSLATYKGHSVLRTLIRCYFSPEYSTAQKYIYTGSSDNSVYIYDLVSGAQVAKLDFHNAPVRDCCWHPIYPMLISSSWDCNIVRWEIPGIGEAPLPKRRTVRARRFFGRALR